jgi:hypothetical protein|tara:strand:- start:237 stop:440 length:204 start_codon:yes stop_codon:yes gene_type:complete
MTEEVEIDSSSGCCVAGALVSLGALSVGAFVDLTVGAFVDLSIVLGLGAFVEFFGAFVEAGAFVEIL